MDILTEIDGLKDSIKNLPPITQQMEVELSNKIRLEYNYNSNHIEGNTLSYSETELLLLFGQTTGEHTFRELDEMKGHDVAYNMIKELAADAERPITESFLKELNQILLVKDFHGPAITPDGKGTIKIKKVGRYKELPNSVVQKDGTIFKYASPQDTPIEMGDLIAGLQDDIRLAKIHPVILASTAHHRFVLIHPFDDGNGRVGRLLLNFILMKFNFPPIIIKSTEKEIYLNCLRQADAGHIEALVNYVGKQVLASLQLQIKAHKNENLEDTDDYKKEIDLIKRRIEGPANLRMSPKLVYDAFEICNKKVWRRLKNRSADFDHLFNESKDFHSVNNGKEVSENPVYSESIFRVANVFENLNTQIFGKDIYSEDVTHVMWRQRKYGLKGAHRAINHAFWLTQDFSFDHYLIELRADSGKNMFAEVLFSLKKTYKQFILDSEISKFESELTRYFLNRIKSDLNESQIK